MLNFVGMLHAPETPRPQTYIATYSDGFGLKRKEIEAPNRLAAYAIATRRPPEGHTLSQLRKKKDPYSANLDPLAERVDVKLTRVLISAYGNTDFACRVVAEEIRNMARRAA